MQQPKKKHQHTVPKMFLSAFACEENENQIFQYSRESLDVFPVAIRKATVQNHAYSIPDHPLVHELFLEDSFMKLESEASLPLLKLRRGERIESLKKVERYRISELFAVQFKRTTAMLQHRDSHASDFARPENTLAYIEKHHADLEKRFGQLEVDKLINRTIETGMGLNVPRQQTLLHAFIGLPRLTDTIFRMNWRIERAPCNQFFVTSDNPVFVRRRGRPRDTHLVGFERDDLGAEVYVALSPSKFLIASWDTPRTRKSASSSRVFELNRLTVLMANRFVYASRKLPSVMELLVMEQDFRLELPDLIGEVLGP
ncbi:DUF4238 domain-containing protein [Novipirellula caenicola]|uniref:DUF4238 domain-containing protein n=1 Tax=Novipirellula caenicola TaxID=1536901 RepID=A0ABP9VS78_9BACT